MLRFAFEYPFYFLGSELLQPLPYLREREMLLLKTADQPEPVDVLGPVMSAGPACFRGREEALLDVVANGPRADFRAVTQLEDIDGFGIGDVEHEAIVTVLLSTVKSK